MKCELDTEEGNVRKLGKYLFVGVGHFMTKNRGSQLKDLRIFCLVSLGDCFGVGVLEKYFIHVYIYVFWDPCCHTYFKHNPFKYSICHYTH